jgi:hypothetical protein
MPSFEYGPLDLSPELETLDEEENRGDTYGARPSGIGILKELGDLKGGKDSHEKEDDKHILKQIKFVL